MPVNNLELIKELEKEILSDNFTYIPSHSGMYKHFLISSKTLEDIIYQLKQLEQIYQQ